MAVESANISVVYTVTSSSSGQQFPIPFPYIAKSDVLAYYAVGETQTNLSYGSGYVVNNSTLTVTGALPVGAKFVIHRETPTTQEIVWVDGQAVYTPDIMQADDKLTYITQELWEKVNRAITVSPESERTPRQYSDDFFEAADQVRADAIQVSADKQAVTSAVSGFDAHVVQKKNEISAEGTTQLNAINAAGTNHLNAINTAGTNHLNAVNAAGVLHLNAVNTAGETQTARVNTAGTTQKAAVDAAGTAQVNAVNSTASAQIEALEYEAARQYQNIHAAGEIQTQRIEDYADRAIDDAAAQADRAEIQAQIAEAAADEITSLAITVESTTTSPGVALLDRENNILRIQVPKGADGATPTFVQGTTTTTETGTLANVSLRTVSTNTYALDFSIPRGPVGAAGRDGERGPAGPSGDISTALDAQFLAFDIDATGNLILKYTGTALEPTYNITPEGYLEVTL